jgi:hypothetical protein
MGIFVLAHRGKRSVESIEFRKARRHCLANSFWDEEAKEKIYLGNADDTVAAVNIALGVRTVPELIPETPQGLVICDPRGDGLFQ